MTPYYQHDGITIYHGDSREIMPSLAGLVVCDPPYNVGYHYDEHGDSMKAEDYQELLRLTCRPKSVVIHYPEEICTLSWTLKEIPAEKVAWIYHSNVPRQHRCIAWFGVKPDFRLDSQAYKNPEDKRIARRMSEGKKARLYDWWQIDQVKNVSGEKTLHPCQIPVSLMRRIIRITPPATIIDPFCGSGTTLRAAKDLGRAAIGIELSERYCEIAAQRMSQEVLIKETYGTV